MNLSKEAKIKSIQEIRNMLKESVFKPMLKGEKKKEEKEEDKETKEAKEIDKEIEEVEGEEECEKEVKEIPTIKMASMSALFRPKGKKEEVKNFKGKGKK